MKVRFLKGYTTRVGNPYTGRRDTGAPEPETYEEGEVVDFYERYVNDEEMKAFHGEGVEGAARFRAQRSAMHFVNRGAAEVVTDDREREARKQRGRTAPPPKAAGEGAGDHDAGGPRAQKPAAEAEGYDARTAEELHAEAARRNIEGRSGLDKAGLVKALERDDKAQAKAAEAPPRHGPQKR